MGLPYATTGKIIYSFLIEVGKGKGFYVFHISLAAMKLFYDIYLS